jgi:hypothetical protein
MPLAKLWATTGAEVVETETAGWGPEGTTPEAVGAIFSSEDIFISCDLTNRSCFPETDSVV